MAALGQPSATMQLVYCFIIKGEMLYKCYYRDERNERFHYHRASWKHFKHIYDRDRDSKQQN